MDKKKTKRIAIALSITALVLIIIGNVGMLIGLFSPWSGTNWNKVLGANFYNRPDASYPSAALVLYDIAVVGSFIMYIAVPFFFTAVGFISKWFYKYSNVVQNAKRQAAMRKQEERKLYQEIAQAETKTNSKPTPAYIKAKLDLEKEKLALERAKLAAAKRKVSAPTTSNNSNPVKKIDSAKQS